MVGGISNISWPKLEAAIEEGAPRQRPSGRLFGASALPLISCGVSAA